MSRVLGLLSLAILATGLWFVIDWIQTDFRGVFWLVLGAVFLAASLFGRGLVLHGLRRPETPAPAPRAEGSEVVVGSGGAPLHVECYGPCDAGVIVLTCGWGFDHSLWDAMVSRLATSWRVLVWDPAGVGRSGHPFDSHYSVGRFAGDLRTVLQLANGEPAVLVGHSLGALAVLELCRGRAPKGVAGAVLLNAAAGSPREATGEVRLLHRTRAPMLASLFKLDVWLSPLVRMASWASYMNGTAHLAALTAGFGDDPPADLVDRAAFVAAGQSPSVQAKALAAALRVAKPDLASIQTPLLVIAGGQDALVGPEACRRTAEAAPQGELLVVEAAGHAGPLEAPEAYAEAIGAFAQKAFDRIAQARAEAARLQNSRGVVPGRTAAVAPERKSWAADDGDDGAKVSDETGSSGPAKRGSVPGPDASQLS